MKDINDIIKHPIDVEELDPFKFEGREYRVVYSCENSKKGKKRYYIKDISAKMLVNNTSDFLRKYFASSAKQIDINFCSRKSNYKKIELIRQLFRSLKFN